MSFIRRSDIERALNDLKSFEEGVRFQRLAVILAKRRWPDLVASERKNDLGLDAVMAGLGVSASITSTYSKIAEDATKTRAQNGAGIERLIFMTSGVVSNPRKREWAERIHKEFSYELTVISREDIVSDLTLPENVQLCTTYLYLDVDVEPSIAEITPRIRAAAATETDNWARHLAGQPLIELQANSVDSDGNDSADAWTHADIATALGNAGRLILEAPAGRGKTTTLIQLARGPLRETGTVFLVDLPLWVGTGQDILSFVADSPAFQAIDVNAHQLAEAHSAERFCFLLNGWNEIGELQAAAVHKLRDLDRRFPAAGILVATRTHHVMPPLPGATRLRLRHITRSARATYVRQRLADRADAVLTSIRTDRAVDDLTRTPFILAELCTVAAAGKPVPRTRVGVIEAAIAAQEQSAEHRAALQSQPLTGLGSEFLESLAAPMMSTGVVSLTEADARAAVHATAQALVARGQLHAPGAPIEVLSTLSAHHVLERFDYPQPGYRFAHQLFQEYYAFRALERRFLGALSSEVERRAFIREFLNLPVWTEPLLMLAERLRERSDAPDASDARDAIIVMALEVENVFAAQLGNIVGLRADDGVGRLLTERLRQWHGSPDPHHRNCAVGAMLASGLDSFRDVLEPLLSSDDQQVRLGTLRLWPAFEPAVLGADWQATVRSWPPDARVSFVSEILHHRVSPEVTEFALADSSPEVKAAAIQGLLWTDTSDVYLNALRTLDDAALFAAFGRGSLDDIPLELRPRVTSLLRGRVPGAPVAQRIQLLRQLHELGDRDSVAELKLTLDDIPEGEFREVLENAIVPALDLLRRAEPEWVSEWVARRIATGKLWKEGFITYVAAVPDDLREAQFARLSTDDLGHFDDGPIAIVTHSATPDLARRAFDRLLEVSDTVAADPTQSHARDRAVLGQLQDLLRCIPPTIVLPAISDLLDPPIDVQVVEAFTDIFSRVARDREPFSGLGDTDRATVHSFIRNSVEIVLQQDDHGGGLKADAASVLAQVGEPQDIGDIMRLVQADLERVRRGREELRRGRSTNAAQGASITQAPWYVHSIVRLLGDAADDVLLPLFTEPEYQTALLEEYARQLGEPGDREMGGRLDYERVWRNREQPVQSLDPASRRARVADAIRGRIQQLESTRTSAEHERHLNGTLKALAGGLAAVAPRHYADEILTLLALPAEFDAYTIVQSLNRLLFAGAILPAHACLELLDRPLEAMKKWGIQDHDRWTIVGFLRICPFVDDPAAGMTKIREIFRAAHLGLHEVREILPALGHSRSNEALALMLDLAPPDKSWQYLQHEWLEALAALDSDDARRLMLGAVDPALPTPPWRTLDWHGVEQLALRIAAMAAADPRLDAHLRELAGETLDESRRAMLAHVLHARATGESTLAALHLIDEAQRPAIPFGVERAIDQTFLEDRPHPGYGNAYTREPVQANQVRARLFSMVFDDNRRKRSAYSLLGKIEERRLEYGRPPDEPRHPDFDSGLAWPPAAPGSGG